MVDVVRPAAEELPEPLSKPANAKGAFGTLEVTAATSAAVSSMGFTQPTEVQEQVIPLLLAGRDVIGQAQTGTGKTAAFGIPIIERIVLDDRYPQAIVLAPTRELAAQIAIELEKLASTLPGVTIATLYGGAGYNRQLTDLEAGAQLIVGTPGRVLDHISRGTLKLDRVHFLVLDEADRMLDMGFLPDVERILRRTPRQRQTALFSATVPTVIRILSRRHMRNPSIVQIKPQNATVDEVEQAYFEVADRDKTEGLLSLFREDPPERAIIFRQTKIGVDRLLSALRRRGLSASAIHGDMSQSVREQVMGEFRAGSLRFLVATDVAARGLDIPEVSHVFNYDIPDDVDAYVHRVGRTARAGRPGTAITFVGEWDFEKLPPIQRRVGDRLERRLLPMYQRSA